MDDSDARAMCEARAWHAALALVPVVYFVRADAGPIKIGHTRHRVDGRLGDLQVGNAAALRVVGMMPGGLSHERALHARFWKTHVRGEWFEPSAELLDYIATRASAGRPGSGTAPAAHEHLFEAVAGHSAVYRCACGVYGRRRLKDGSLRPISGTTLET